MPTLYTHNLRFKHQQQLILDNIQLYFKPNSFTVLLGENGAGKSTLLKLLAGLLEPTAGAVFWDQQPINHFKRQEWARLCSFMPQHLPLSVDFSVWDLVSMGRYPHRARFAPLSLAEHDLIDSALKQLDINKLAKRAWGELSGGEQQRVFIARSLVTQSPVLLLDEPSASLDLRHQLDSLLLFKQLAAQGHTVICSSHDLNLSRQYADNIVLLHHGSVYAQGTAKQVLNAANIKQVFGVNIHELKGFNF